MTKLPIFMISMLLLSGYTRHIVANPEQTIERNQTLQLKVVDDTLALEYEGDLTNEFGTINRADSIKNFFVSEFAKNLLKSKKFESATYNSEPIQFSSSKFACYLYSHRNKVDSVRFSIPQSPLLDSGDITLFLENITIKSSVHVSVSLIGLFPVVTPNKPLTIESKYLFWNNRENKAIAWGVANAGYGEIGPHVDITTWRASIENYSRRILEKVSFDTKTRKKITAQVSKDTGTVSEPVRFNQFRNTH